MAATYARGVIRYSTAGHGGFHVSKALNRNTHPALRLDDGWYEEDLDWARVALAFPTLFDEKARGAAESALRHYFPDDWEGFYGRKLQPGESRARDEAHWAAEHARDWVGVSAVLLDGTLGMVRVTATIGGRREGEERVFIVPEAEYDAARTGRVGGWWTPDTPALDMATA